MTAGYVNIGDISGGATSGLGVGGGILSASKTIDNGTSVVTVNFASQVNTNYVPMISFHSMGARNDDNDFEQPVIISQTATSIQVFLDETNSVSQNLRMYVLLMKY